MPSHPLEVAPDPGDPRAHGAEEAAGAALESSPESTAGPDATGPVRTHTAPRRLERALLAVGFLLAAGGVVGWAREASLRRRAQLLVAGERAARTTAERLARAEHDGRTRAEQAAHAERDARARAERNPGSAPRVSAARTAPVDENSAAAAARTHAPVVSVRTGSEVEQLAASVRAVGQPLAAGQAPPAAAVEALGEAIVGVRRSFPIRGRTAGAFVPVLSADGRHAALLGGDGRVRIWDTARRTAVATLRVAGDAATAAEFSPDGARVLLWQGPAAVSLWDAHNGRALLDLASGRGAPRVVRFSPDGLRVLDATDDGTAYLFDARTGTDLVALRGHVTPLRVAEFSRDGAQVATSGEDGVVRLWDAARGLETAHFAPRGRGALEFVYGPDGARLAVVSGPPTAITPEGESLTTEHSVQLFDARSGALLAGLDEAARPGLPPRFSADGARLLTATADTGLALWDARSGARVAALRTDVATLAAAGFSADGTHVVATDRAETVVFAAADGAVVQHIPVRAGAAGAVSMFSPDGEAVFGAGDGGDALYSVETGEQEALLRGNTGGVTLAQFAADGERLLTVGRDFGVRLWETSGGELLEALQGHAAPVRDARFVAGGALIATASADGSVRVWDEHPGFALQSFHERVVEFAPGGSQLLVAGGATPRLLQVRTGAPLAALDRALAGARLAGFSDDGDRIVFVDVHGALTVWDARNAVVAARGDAESPRAEVHAALSGDASRVLLAAPDGAATLRDGATAAVLGRFQGELYAATSFALSHDGARALVVRPTGQVEVLDARTGRVVATLGGPDAQLESARFSPDGTRVVTAGPDDPVKVWDARDGALVATLDEYGVAAFFSPDGARVAVVLGEDARASAQGPNRSFVRIWDARGARILATLDGHPGAIGSVAFSPDGTRVATGSDDRTARIWDAASGQLVVTLVGHGDEVTSVAFSPDGTLLRTLSGDHTARLFPATAQGVLLVGCRLLRAQPEYDAVRRYCAE